MRKLKIFGVVALCAIVVSACVGNNEQSKKGGENAVAEQKAVADGFGKLTKSQQIPVFDYSQERQTVIDAETIRATGATSTSMFYVEGVGMEWWCPSSGAPVPSTYQLSASQQYVDIPGDESREKYPLDQGEPTGVYVGSSNGTWVICLDDAGSKFGVYWEGPVGSLIGSTSGLDPAKRMQPNEITYQFGGEEDK